MQGAAPEKQGFPAYAAPFIGGLVANRFLIALTILAFVTMVGGGASRGDALSLLFVRPTTILILAFGLVGLDASEFKPFKPLFALLIAWTLVIAIQLVPLPPAVWASLRGRDQFVEAAIVAGISSPWRPLSVTPDQTWNSLIAMVTPAAALVILARLRRAQLAAPVLLLLAIVFASAFLGILQIGGVAPYLYEVTDRGFPVGFFANRNHEAVMLAMVFPTLRIWTLLPGLAAARRRRLIIACAAGALMVPMILVTGSRAGMAISLASIVASLFIAPLVGLRLGKVRLSSSALRFAIVAMFAVLAIVTISLGRGIALERALAVHDYRSEYRVEATPIMLQIVGKFLPWGTGFGSFPVIFKIFEPDRLLDTAYFNHAHDDFIEIILTGGVIAVLVFIGFIYWYCSKAIPVFRRSSMERPAILLGRLGAVLIAIVIAASSVDYPVHTPLMMLICTIGCAWLQASVSYSKSGEYAPREGEAVA